MQPLTRRFLSLALVAAFTLAPALRPAAASEAALTERKLEAPANFALEVQNVVQLLEEAHYNREAVKSTNYAGVLPDFMGSLDGQRMFFLESDKQNFLKANATELLYLNIKRLGNIDPAYEIFSIYETRVRDRAAWIAEELKKDIDLTGQDTYSADRAKADWPANPAAADDLWRRRLKFDLIQEMLAPSSKAVDLKYTKPSDGGATMKPAPAVTKTLAEAKAAVAKRYERLPKNVAELDASDLAEVFLTSIAQLYDPHSTYFSPTSYDDFSIQMRLQLVGIGALLSLEDDYCVVKELVPGGPADLGKQLKPNDKITAIAQDNAEAVDVIGMKLRKIVQMIRGNKGTKVHLFVESGEGSAAVRREVVIDRDVVNLDSSRAHAAIFTVPGSGGQPAHPVGVITLPSFYGSDPTPEDPNPAITSKDVAELIKRLKAQNIQGIVLDLRHNGGGLLGEAVNLTGLFIKSGPVVQVRDHEGKISSGQTKSEEVAWNGPLAVLVDRFSASASEIVAGALQNYGRAVIIGDSSTHGKGTVQTIVELSRLRRPSLELLLGGVKTGAAKLTIQKFYLPNGASTQLRGVIPDLILPSVDDFLPIGESSLPHALGWDEIPSAKFDGPALTPATLTLLRTASDARRRQLPEFSYLQSGINWLKTKFDEKDASLNLARREQEKTAEADHKKVTDAELKKLEQTEAYAFTEIMLAPPPPPRIKADKPSDSGLNELDETNPDERYAKMDINLRESLRVVSDSLNLAPQSAQWLLNGPSTAQTMTKLAPASATP
ncbi:MAG: carboxy terminal-processing peptidase [Verrucomicrobiota bacterium]